jgi:hypothetical protein
MHLLRFPLVGLGLLALFAACETSDKGGAPDADPAAPLCTGVLYDNCTTDAQCMTGMCKLFAGEFQVCTQACTAGDDSTCPSSSGMTSKCNNRGICKPAINNACRPPS